MNNLLNCISLSVDSKVGSVEVEATLRPFPTTDVDTGEFIIYIRHANVYLNLKCPKHYGYEFAWISF